MKKFILKFRQTNRGIFRDLKNGIKKVETRAATSKYQKMRRGDVVIFTCGSVPVERKIKKITLFKSIAALVKYYPVDLILPGASVEELRKVYSSFPGYKEKIKKFGIIAFEI